MDDIVGELRDCAADAQEVGYKSRAQVAMLRAADDIVALQGRNNQQCDMVNKLVATVEALTAERDYLRARNDSLLEDRARMRGHLFRIRDGGARTTSGKWLDWTRSTLREVAQDALNGAPVPVLKGETAVCNGKSGEAV